MSNGFPKTPDSPKASPSDLGRAANFCTYIRMGAGRDDIRDRVLRLLHEVRVEEREACARLLENGDAPAGSTFAFAMRDAAEILRSTPRSGEAKSQAPECGSCGLPAADEPSVCRREDGTTRCNSCWAKELCSRNLVQGSSEWAPPPRKSFSLSDCRRCGGFREYDHDTRCTAASEEERQKARDLRAEEFVPKHPEPCVCTECMHPTHLRRESPRTNDVFRDYVPFSKRPRSVALEKVAEAAAAFIACSDADGYLALRASLAELDQVKP